MNTAKKHQLGVKEAVSSKNNSLKLAEDVQAQKAQIENLKKLIGEKIKNPSLAKKAALILSEMLTK